MPYVTSLGYFVRFNLELSGLQKEQSHHTATGPKFEYEFDHHLILVSSCGTGCVPEISNPSETETADSYIAIL